MANKIYADNAATTKMDQHVFEAMLPYLQAEYGNASQPYSFARTAKQALAKSRETIAMCINAKPDEIFFTSGGTESDNWALKGMMEYGDNRATITSQIEHHAILNSCAAIERMGFPVTYLPVDEQGVVSPATLEKYITNKTKLVSVMTVNNEIGTIEPIRDLTAIAHKHGALMHTDAVQAVGHMFLDVADIGVDMLSASAHKFNGPKGIGFLYIKKGVKINPHNDGGAQEYNLRAGTENIASIVGMAEALSINNKEIRQHQQKLLQLEQKLLARLSTAGVDYHQNGSEKHIPGNISLSFKNMSGEALLHRLDLMGIYVSTGSACDSQNTQISHVLQAINAPVEYALGTIRISLGKDNSEDDVEGIARALIKLIEQQKSKTK